MLIISEYQFSRFKKLFKFLKIAFYWLIAIWLCLFIWSETYFPAFIGLLLIIAFFLNRKKKLSKFVNIILVICAVLYLIFPFEFKIEFSENYGVKILPIVYGLPTDSTMQAAINGEIALGGCVISEILAQPRYRIFIQMPD